MVPFLALAQHCAPTVAPQTMAAVVKVESGFNPYAIGVVGGRLARQPSSVDEAIATAQSLQANGWNFSVGIAQVNKHNLPKFGVTYAQAFDPCTSLRMGSSILEECYSRAIVKMPGEEQAALRAAFSCYYAGNFTGGFKASAGKPSYVQKVVASADVKAKPIPVVPTIQRGGVVSTAPDNSAAAPVTADTLQSVALPAPTEPAVPADHTSVMVDLHPTSAAPAPAPATGANDVADTAAPVVLQVAQPTTPAPQGEVATDNVTIF